MQLPDLTILPKRLKMLPVYRGFPVPWFVQYIDDKPEFRLADPEKFRHAVKLQLCWICGGYLGAYKTFVIGPMCVITRTSADPPSHQACAEWAVKNCPFLSNPNFERRTEGLPEDLKEKGCMIKRNPAVSALWVTKNYDADMREGLLTIGECESVTFWREGRQATEQEIKDSVESGLPTLVEMAEKHNEMPELQNAISRAMQYFTQGLSKQPG